MKADLQNQEDNTPKRSKMQFGRGSNPKGKLPPDVSNPIFEVHHQSTNHNITLHTASHNLVQGSCWSASRPILLPSRCWCQACSRPHNSDLGLYWAGLKKNRIYCRLACYTTKQRSSAIYPLEGSVYNSVWNLFGTWVQLPARIFAPYTCGNQLLCCMIHQLGAYGSSCMHNYSPECGCIFPSKSPDKAGKLAYINYKSKWYNIIIYIV